MVLQRCTVWMACILMTEFVIKAAAHGRQLQDHRTHVYQQGDIVVLYANKVGPYHNPR